MVHGRHAVGQDATAHEEHGRGSHHRQHAHQHRRRLEQTPPDRRGETAAGPHEVEAEVIELDDAGDKSVHPDRHQQGDARQHRHLRGERRPRHGAQRDRDDFTRQDEVGADRPLDLVALEGDQIDGRVRQSLGQLGAVGLVLVGAVQVAVGDLLEAFETQVGPPDHQQRQDQPRRERADEQGDRHQDHLVEQGALGHRPHHRQLAVGGHAGDLLGIEGQVVTEHTGRLLRGHLGQDGHVIEYGGDVVEQGKQAGSGHRESPVKKSRGC